MAIDHKLEGRRRKDLRTGKWKRQKGVPAPVKSAVNAKGKVQVLFDEQARSEWLTGFGKRKAERRKFGLAMQILKDKKLKKEALRQIRAPDDDDNNNNDNDIDNNNNDNNDDNDNNDIDNEIIYDDDQTTGMFGGAVSVVVDTGVSDAIDELYKDSYSSNGNDDDDNRSVTSYKSNSGRSKDVRETSLQRAMKEVAKKNLLTKRKKFNSPNPFPKGKRHVDGDSSKTKKKGTRASGKTLMNKALGGQSFKGKHKGRRPS